MSSSSLLKNISLSRFSIRLLTGAAALALGALIYICDRDPDSTYFVREFFGSYGGNIHNILPGVFGVFSANMASFLHSFAFTMITGAFIADSGLWCLFCALLWCGINIIFEVGQYFDAIAVKFIPGWFELYPVLDTVDDFFISGTFDLFDIAAATAGAFIGYILLVMTMEKA